MNRQKELAKNTLILTVGKISTQFVSFMLLPLYTALLIPAEFGIVDLFNTYIILLIPIFNWQFDNGLFRFMIDFRNDHDGQKRLFSTVFVTNIIQAGVYLILFAVFQNYIKSEYKIFLAIDVVATIFINTLLQFPRGLGKNSVYSKGSFISAVVTILLNVVFIAMLRWGAYGMFIATILGKFITIVYLFIAMKTWDYFSFRAVDKTVFKSVSKYSFPLVPNQMAWWVVGASDRMVISHFISVAANGIYSVANKFSAVFVTFFNIFILSWTESVTLHVKDDDRDVFLTDVINKMFNLFAAANIGIIAFMPFVFRVLINEQYNDAYYQIPILMIAVLFQVVVGLYSVIYVALKKSTEIAKTSFMASVINLSIDLILIKVIGLYAASVSTLVAYAAMAIYRYFDVKKYVNVCFKRRNLIITISVGTITILTYYSKNNIYSGIALLCVGIYAVLINREFLLFIYRIVKNKLVKIHR